MLNTMADSPVLKKTDANIIGHVIDKKTGEHLPYITVALKGTTIGTTTDATGHYFLKNLPEGKFTIEARFVGYQTVSKEVELKKGNTLEINFELEESNISLNEVVVSANRNETSRRLAPTLVSILDVKTFEKTNSYTIADGLGFQPGLRVENNCQNCGFTQVRMNGLEGAYSQILIDSRPVFSSLAGVYGLEQIPATMVERIEIVRGGGSALFGSSAIAGTINIITKEPLRNSAQLSHNIMSIGGKSDFDNNTNFNASLVSDDHRMGVMVFGQKRYRSAYDDDGDGFSEVPHLNSRTLGFRSFIKTGPYSKITFEYHNMNEFRRGGDRIREEPHNAYIAEQIDSDINGGSLKYDIFSSDTKHRFSIYTAAQDTKRKSYYGGGEPVSTIMTDDNLSDAEKLEAIEGRMNSYGRTKDFTYSIGGQYSYDFDKLLFMPSSLTAGLEYTSDDLEDKSGYRENTIEQKVDTKSAFAQNEWKDAKWSFLLGGRLDKHKLLKNVIFSPRANIRYNPEENINIRLSYGQGFRAPQLFDEDLHVDLAGGEQIIRQLSPDLKEEKSHSISGSVDWYYQTGSAELNFLVEGFYTKLKDPFTSVSSLQEDGSTIKTIINASGAKVYGLNFEVRIAYSTLLQLQLGATVQKSLYDEARKWSDEDDDGVEPEKRMLRTPDVYGYFVATVTPVKRFSTNLSGKYTGNMLVPYEGGGIRNRTQKTSSFFELGWKVAYEIPFYKGTNIEINAGIQNIFNSYQDDFDKGPDRVSSYIYGPALPRSYFAGAKLSF
nr:TonB-dependent receptor [Prevotella sp. 10(H)]